MTNAEKNDTPVYKDGGRAANSKRAPEPQSQHKIEENEYRENAHPTSFRCAFFIFCYETCLSNSTAHEYNCLHLNYTLIENFNYSLKGKIINFHHTNYKNYSSPAKQADNQ